MRLFSLARFLRKISVSQKFYILICVTLLILVLQIISFWSVMGILSSIRAYVGGEGLWSKAQKASMNSLLQYSVSLDEADYKRSQEFLLVPLGDHHARIELEKETPDTEVVKIGFKEGGNHPDDFDGMIFLFRNFGGLNYMKQAITTWTEGDVLIARQVAIGEQMHTLVVESGGSPDQDALALLVDELVTLDAELTTLENRFSAGLSEAYRGTSTLLFDILLSLTVFFGLMALLVALYIARIVSQVDQAKSEFVALASHQLRTPLSIIKLSAEMLSKANISSLGRDEQKALGNISNEVPKMAAMIDTILDVSRIELGKLLINPLPLDVVAEARTAVAEAQVAAQAKDMKIVELYNPESVISAMDAPLLNIILENLLSNAIKYSPTGGEVRLSVTTDRSKILIKVSDTGYGIPEEKQSKIFSKLYRAGNTRGQDPGGSGLGLYIVKSIVREAGGSIWFESKEGEGTSFYVTFPLSGMEKSQGNVQI